MTSSTDKIRHFQNQSEAVLLAEYHSLTEAIFSLRNQQLTLNSITITGVIIALSFALQQGKQLGTGPLSLPMSGWIALSTCSLTLTSWRNDRGTVSSNRIRYKRVTEIEDELGMKGHHWVNQQTMKTERPRFGVDSLWDPFYAILLSGTILVALHLFGLPGI